MASFESIGPCSLSPESSSLQGDDLTASERALKSLSFSSADSPPPPAKPPSYLGISCAVNGYTGFSRFCHGSSLSNGVKHSAPLVLPPLYPPSPINPAPDVTDRVNGHHDAKSLVQRRIESLYGKETAATFRSPRAPRGQNLRSPSCPPSSQERGSTRTPSRSPPVFKKLAPSFKEQLRTAAQNPSSPPKPSAELQKPVAGVMVSENGVVERDGHWFLAVMEKEKEEIESRMAGLELRLGPGTGEEEAGHIRAALGQASLLLTSKLEHFRELCHNNLGTGPLNTPRATSEDLAGLWDLIALQVESVKKNLAPNSQPAHAVLPAAPPKSSRRQARPTAPRASREEARKRLAEAKQRARRNQQRSSSPDIAIFVAGDPPAQD